MPYIVDVATSLPQHYYEQETLITAFLAHWGHGLFNPTRLTDFHRHVGVKGRYLAMPLDWYPQVSGLKARNEAFLTVATNLLVSATTSLLQRWDLVPSRVASLWSSTVTGIAVPSLEARLMNHLAFAPETKRVPLFGLGCLAGAAGMARVADYLRAFPDEAALFMTVELCSLTLQPEDFSIANIVSSGLFGDGCGVVLMVGDRHPLAEVAPLKVCASRSCFFPDSQRVMGFDVVDSGLKVVLSREVATMVSQHLPTQVAGFLAAQGLGLKDLGFLVAHPGGPKVLQALQAALELPEAYLAASYEVLAEFGNMSSASVLFVLERLLTAGGLPPAGYGLLNAMGPGFCAELLLLASCRQPQQRAGDLCR